MTGERSQVYVEWLIREANKQQQAQGHTHDITEFQVRLVLGIPKEVAK